MAQVVKIAKRAARAELMSGSLLGVGAPGVAAIQSVARDVVAAQVRQKQAKQKRSAPKKIIGSGEYQLVTNDLFSKSGLARPSHMSVSDAAGDIILERREYIGDIISAGSSSFANTVYAINPSVSSVFPFLSQIALGYEEYRFEALAFEYNPIVVESSTSGSMGSVFMAANYNSAAPPFTTKLSMLDYANAISGRICDGVMLGVECDPRKNGMSEFLYTRSGPVPVGQDVKTYDLCTVQLGVQGVSLSAGTLLGEVWVYYKVRLLKPKLYSPSGTIQMDIFLGGAASSNTLWMGAAPSRSTGNTLGCTLAKTGNSRLTLPDTFVGYVRVICYALTTTFAGNAAISFPSGSAILGYTDLIDASFSPGNPVANTFVTGANEVLLITDLYVPSVATSPGANAIDITLGTSFVATAGSAYLQVQALSSAPGPLAGAGNKLVLV